ncbi:MAG TPA: DUF72 domain-containing protein [Gemmatimonadales bacterium]
MIRVGPAGWDYKDWAGIAYPSPPPPEFDRLAWIARFFDTIEINSSFYGPPAAATAKKWVTRVAGNPDFTFTAKLWRRFTHERKTAFTRAEIREACAGIGPLHDQGRLGALLLQFPWSFRRTDENRQWLDDVTRTFARFPQVIEVRHASWNVPDFYEELVERGIGFVNIDQPLFRQSIGPSSRVTSQVGYVRVHGRNYADWFRKDAGVEARYDYLYPPEELEPWVKRTREIAKATRETYVITNNHYRAQALVNALMLESMLTKRKVEAPPGVVEQYPDELKGFARPAKD